MVLNPTPHLSNQGTNHREPKWIKTFVPLVPRSVCKTIDPQCPSGYCVTLLKWALNGRPLNQVFWIFLHNRQLMKAKGRVEPSVGRVSVSGAFLIPGLVSLFFLKKFNRPGEVFQKKINQVGFKQFIPANSQTWFLDNRYQNFCFFKKNKKWNLNKFYKKFTSPKVHF